MVNYDDIGRSRGELEVAQRKLIKVYLSKIQKTYMGLGPREISLLANGLEDVVRLIEEDFPEPSTNNPEIISKRPNLTFNRKVAVKVREINGITTIKGLADELGFNRAGYIMLCRYEKGIVRPRNPPMGKVPRIYVQWLKEHGYDPYGL